MLLKSRSQTYTEEDLLEKRKQYGVYDLFNMKEYEINFKNDCVKCGKNIKKVDKFSQWDHYLMHGNFCSSCSGEAHKNVNYFIKKEDKIDNNLLKRFQKISESFERKLSTFS